VDRVHIGQRAGGVSHLNDPRNRVERAHSVRGQPDGNQARPRPQRSLEAVQVERAVFLADIDPSDSDATFLFQGQPRRDVGVVVETSGHDLVTRPERSPDRAAHGEGQRGHVLTEDDLAGIGGPEVVRRGRMDFRQHAVALLARRESALVVGVTTRQVVRHGVDRLPGHLRAAGAVQVDVGPAVLHS
jgi:hypothetical protein